MGNHIKYGRITRYGTQDIHVKNKQIFVSYLLRAEVNLQQRQKSYKHFTFYLVYLSTFLVTQFANKQC